MLKAAMEKMLDLAKVEVIEVGVRKFTSRKVEEVKPFTIDPITVHSLRAVVDFFKGELKQNRDVDTGNVLIHIVDPYTVKVVSGAADQTYRNREHYLTAKCIHDEFDFGKYHDQEQMIIKLMTLFVQDEKTAVIRDVISRLTVRSDVELEDDGVSQDVTVRKTNRRGDEKITIENPMTLRPIRTFTEVDQVSAPYVLRVKDMSGIPNVAIFDASADHWKNDAITNIRQFLEKELPGVKILG